jgi:hypothetical protein
MPGILDLVTQALGGDAVQHLSTQLGTNPQQTQSAISAALPMLLAGLARQSQGGGADALHASLGQHDGNLLNDVAGFLGGGGGNAAGLLGQVLGQHQGIAQQAVAGASGLGGAQAQQLLGMLAPVVMGALSRTTQAQGLDAQGLASMLQGEHRQLSASLAQSQPGLMGLATQLLDANHDGNLVDDLTRGLGGLLGGRS